ncbi:uncharacterized protein BP5553_00616 [Venustampulla echinocandica]|uniref:Nucleic acid-binding protein n=1 Tax=Venustampulla echinocandica TaxID=2656787 RepID=A0A370TYM8_9HELO|nr:uncharacterized protein BP5553_00616 [Venustampulla echinocandica]RDL40637.1 hypothetical protein BP5553_00616 [Venustampulla echinocandica]
MYFVDDSLRTPLDNTVTSSSSRDATIGESHSTRASDYNTISAILITLPSISSPPNPASKMSSFLLRRAATTTARSFSTSASRPASFAKITIVGRLGDVPELQATSTGKELLKYNVGTSSGPKDNQQTNWFRVASFLPEGPQRDYIAGLEKGTLVYVEGDVSINQYQDGEGVTRRSFNIVQRKLEVLARKRQQESEEM